MSVAARLTEVRARILASADRAGRDPAGVRLVTVTKGHGVERIQEVMDAGATILGENRIEEAEQKIPALRDAPVEWHMIGHLQSRKAGRAAELFALVHSLDRPKTAAILGRSRQAGTPLDVLVEVNVAADPAKHGARIEDVRGVLDAALEMPSLRVRGLMAMAPYVKHAEEARPVFARLRTLRDELAAAYAGRCELAELSMGMTNDFEVAVEEGATLVRVGTAIMGPRNRA